MPVSKRTMIAPIALLASMIVIGAVLIARSPTTPPGSNARGADGEREEEALEQALTTELRLDALADARRDGTLGVIEGIARTPAPGWAGEEIVNETGDDWEPAIATDPDAPYVYVLHNRYGGEPACGNCPDPAMILHVSTNGGRTWQPERYLCRCRGIRGQYDPLLEVVPGTGDVYAAWMNNFRITFSRSSDHGRTWTRPVFVHPEVNWGDKPNMAVSADGRDVYLLYNGPSGGDVRAAVSHDGGATWSSTRITDGERYYFNYGGEVLPDGRVVFGHISFSYTGPGGAPEGPLLVHLIASDDDGATWTDLVVDELEVGSECRSAGCYEDYYDSGPSVTADEDGDLVMVYNGASEPLGPRTVYARSSTDGGRTWSERVRISRLGVNAAYPAAIAEGDGVVRLWYMDQRTGRWNVWYTTSTDLGATWATAERISDARSGTVYKNGAGFREAYGDYGEIAITSSGATIAVWGEGRSYTGPGGVWFNREL
jgi:hypothetical protein